MNRRLITAVLAGVCIGITFGLALSTPDNPRESRQHLWSFIGGLTLTGFVVGWSKQPPISVGIVCGAVMLWIAASIVGPKNGWMLMVAFFYGIGGAVGGLAIGLLTRWFG